MAMLSSPPPHFPVLSPHSSSKTQLTHKPNLFLRPKRQHLLLSIRATDNGSGVLASAATVEDESKDLEAPVTESKPKTEVAAASLGENGSPAAGAPEEIVVAKYENPKWVGGTWDLKQFQKDGTTDWDAVIDAGILTFHFIIYLNKFIFIFFKEYINFEILL